MTQERHEMEIVIDQQGRITVEVKGAKGRACLDYEKMFERNVGRVKRKTLTSEFYEPGREASIADAEKTRTHRLGDG